MSSERLDDERATSLRLALHEWVPQQARYLADQAEATICAHPDWAAEDDFATQCEKLAAVARFQARLGKALDDHTPLTVCFGDERDA